MSPFVFVLCLVALLFVAPVMAVLHYWSKSKEKRGLTKDDEMMLEDLWKAAKKMEDRLNSLETILGKEPQDEGRA